MSSIHTYLLDNGLRVVIESHPHSAMAVVNLLFHVGSCDEDPLRTGLAHFHEHVMFGGSKHAPHYDAILESIGGSNNAYTSQDVTNYWCKVPANQLEVALWLESDRMVALSYPQEAIETQRKVIIEEFKQTTIDRPYGEVWGDMLSLAFSSHSYRWPTIGATLKHIEEASREELIALGKHFYTPSNAILSIVGHVDREKTMDMVNKWFGSIPAAPTKRKDYKKEPQQKKAWHKEVYRSIPQDAWYKTYKIPPRHHPDYAALEILGYVLAHDDASLLHEKLIHKEELCSEVQAYPVFHLQEGLFWLGSKLHQATSFESVESAIGQVIEQVKQPISELTLTQAKNQYIAQERLQRTSSLERAEWYAYGMLLGNVHFFEEEIKRIQPLTSEELARVAQTYFIEEQSATLYYKRSR